MATAPVAPAASRDKTLYVAILGLVILLGWVYWPTLALMIQTWSSDPQYSHGYLVPVFAALLLWLRRGRAHFERWQPSWWGVALVVAGGLIRLAGGVLSSEWLDSAALLPCVAGLVLVLGGGAALGWSWPAIAFLAFMIPLPYRVAHALSGPLQQMATELSGLTMQTLGLPALAEGNTILLDGHRIAIVEACSGLSMLITFGALATGFAIIVRRPLLDRILLLLSAIPIAILANVLRITATGVALHTAGQRLADTLFHDLAGWLMMPLALAMLALELRLLDILLVMPPQRRLRPPIPGVGDLAARNLPPRSAQRRPRSVSSPPAGV